MTAMRQAMNAYGQAVETTPPAKQIVMLYDGILRQITVARDAIENGRVNDRFIAVQKATLIVEALQGCLDHEKGGEIAPQLDQIYTYIIFRLQAINIDNDPAICDELLERAGDLRGSWATLAETEAPTARQAAPGIQNPEATAPITA